MLSRVYSVVSCATFFKIVVSFSSQFCSHVLMSASRQTEVASSYEVLVLSKECSPTDSAAQINALSPSLAKTFQSMPSMFTRVSVSPGVMLAICDCHASSTVMLWVSVTVCPTLES